MKSPWKYLAELASLGRKVKATERPPETASTTGEASPTPEEHSRAPVAPTKEVGSSEVEVRLEPEPSTEESETPESATITTVDSPRSDAYALERVPSAQPRSRKVTARKDEKSQTSCYV